MKLLSHTIRGTLALALYVINTFFFCVPLFAVALLKVAVPFAPWRRLCSRALNGIAGGWIGVNIFNQNFFSSTPIHVSGPLSLDPDGWYLVMANHQSWVDILVLQRIFHSRIPMLKFFLKKELIWVPLLGLAWWALDFPFMKRYSKSFLEKNPHLRGKDIEITKRTCQRFKTIPVSIMNFVEGTRFTVQKHSLQGSPYTHLLKTKAGGIALVLTAMGEQIRTILDVTIAYPGRSGSFWRYISGGIPEIRVAVRPLPVDPSLMGNYAMDDDFRTRFQTWLNELWAAKDARMGRMLSLNAATVRTRAQNEECPRNEVPEAQG
ncbi:MAG: acyltransferase [Deltaproteobacteria bacterium]|nr:acyltransferase [Deltaproteobacteria bacterium]